MAATEYEMEDVEAQRYRLRADHNSWVDATLKLELKALYTAVAARSVEIARTILALRGLLLRVVVNWEAAELVLH